MSFLSLLIWILLFTILYNCFCIKARMCVRPEDMFKSQTDLYSAFDAEGIPTHDAQGQELSKNGVKKLKKEWEKQKRLYETATAGKK